MKLSIKDRILILNLLPKQGNYMEMTLKTDIAKKLVIAQDEMTEVEMKSEDGTVLWNVSKEKEKNFEFTEVEKTLITDELKKLDLSKSLTDDTIGIYKMFI